MEIVQFRGGFATNSSSSHSIVFYPGGASDKDLDGHQEFGWGWFILGSKEAKAEYAAQAFKHMDHELVFKYLGVYPKMDGYIDHESVGMLGWVQTEEDLKTFVRLYIDNEDVVILGGNDNDDYDSNVPLDGEDMPGFHPDMQWRNGDNFLVIFDARNGNKTHLAKERGTKIGFVTADFPELVDLKVSDYCTLGCSFCYQNSTRRGKHGDPEYIKQILDELGRLGTFEVAIGGGEPLQYPHLREILQHARSKNIIPNFTTKDYDGLIKNLDLLDLVGGVAISVASIGDVQEAIYALAGINQFSQWSKLSFQIPVGAQGPEEFTDMLSAISTTAVRRVTLLGYKMVGRGTESKYHPFEDQLYNLLMTHQPSQWNQERHVPTYPTLNIGVDTQLANIGGSILEIVPRHARDKVVMQSEGLHSCYIDAVTRRIAPSSYCDDHLYQPLVINEIGEVFNEFSTEASQSIISAANSAGDAIAIAVQTVG